MSNLADEIDKILSPIFSYGIDWTEHRDKGGPDGDHDVSVFAGTIKGDMQAQAKAQILALVESRLPDELKVTEKIPLDGAERGYNIAIQDVRANLGLNGESNG